MWSPKVHHCYHLLSIILTFSAFSMSSFYPKFWSPAYFSQIIASNFTLYNHSKYFLLSKFCKLTLHYSNGLRWGFESQKSLKYAEPAEYEWMCGVGWNMWCGTRWWWMVRIRGWQVMVASWCLLGLSHPNWTLQPPHSHTAQPTHSPPPPSVQHHAVPFRNMEDLYDILHI